MARMQEPNSEDTTLPAVEKRVGHARRLVQKCKLLDYVRRDLTCRAWHFSAAAQILSTMCTAMHGQLQEQLCQPKASTLCHCRWDEDENRLLRVLRVLGSHGWTRGVQLSCQRPPVGHGATEPLSLPQRAWASPTPESPSPSPPVTVPPTRRPAIAAASAGRRRPSSQMDDQKAASS